MPRPGTARRPWRHPLTAGYARTEREGAPGMTWLRRLWRTAWRWVWRQPLPLRTVWVDDLPDILEAKRVYIVGEGGHLWFAALLCPCGCGATVHTSFMPDSRPRWTLTVHADGTISLAPSIWRTRGCCSHFFLRRGVIAWCSPRASF